VTTAFAIYFALVLLIAVIAWWRTRDLSDYLLGGKRLGPATAALSAGASDMSGWLLLGLPGYAYLAGLEALWLAAALLLGSYCNWLWVAPRLRQACIEHRDVLTLPDLFARRADSHQRALRLVAALLIFVFYLVYTASGFVAGAKLFETVYGIDYQSALLVGGGVIVAYTFFGGFLAVAWTDVLQGLMMLVALLAIPLFVLLDADSTSPVIVLDWTRILPRDATGAFTWLAWLSSLAWGLGYFGQPHILARFMALRPQSPVSHARRIATSWTALCLVGAIAVGLAGQALLGPTLDDAETVFMRMVEVLFHPLVAGVLLAAIMAAIMSTADSQLLVASSVLSEDLCRGLLPYEFSSRQLLWLGRGAVLLLAVLALAMAWRGDSAVLDLVGYAWAGFGASLGPAVIYCLYAERVSGKALLAGMLFGGVTVIVWRQLEGGIFDLYEMVPGVLVAGLGIALCHPGVNNLPRTERR
jgi:sodium/proline symporter